MTNQSIEKAQMPTALAVVEHVTSLLNEWTDKINEASKLSDFEAILDQQKAMTALLNTRAAAKGLGAKLEFYKRKVSEMEAKAHRRLGELARTIPEKTRSTEVKKLGISPKRMQDAVKSSELPQKQFDGYLKATEREATLPKTRDIARLAEMPPAERKRAFATFGESAKVSAVIDAAVKALPEVKATPKHVTKPVADPDAKFVRLASTAGSLSRKSAEFHRETLILAGAKNDNLFKLQTISKELRALNAELRDAYKTALEQLDRVLAR
jgi:hypothetical protein